MQPVLNINIGIQTAANALRNFLDLGTASTDCTAILSEINTKLRLVSKSSQLQSIVKTFLESDLLSSACDAWHLPNLNEELATEILCLFRLVTISIVEGSGEICEGILYLNAAINSMVCSFVEKLYDSALKIQGSPVKEHDNVVISTKLVTLFAASPRLMTSFYQQSPLFTPLDYFVIHPSTFYREIARLLAFNANSPVVAQHFSEPCEKLSAQLEWAGSTSFHDPVNNWKIQFMTELINEPVFNISQTNLLVKFLHLIDAWKTLVKVCLYFINLGARAKQVGEAIAEVIDSRLMLLSKNLAQVLENDLSELCIYDFMVKSLETESYPLIAGLFYSTKAESIGSNAEEATVKRVRERIHILMGSSSWFSDNFCSQFPRFQRATPLTWNHEVLWDPERSLAVILASGIQNFHRNLVLKNRYIATAVWHLTQFDCRYMDGLGPGLLPVVQTYLESLNAHNYANTILGLDVKPNRGVREDSRLRQTGLKQNLYLFETTMSTLYAGIRAKQSKNRMKEIKRVSLKP